MKKADSVSGYLLCLHSLETDLSSSEELGNNNCQVENLFLPIAMCNVVLAE